MQRSSKRRRLRISGDLVDISNQDRLSLDDAELNQLDIEPVKIDITKFPWISVSFLNDTEPRVSLRGVSLEAALRRLFGLSDDDLMISKLSGIIIHGCNLLEADRTCLLRGLVDGLIFKSVDFIPDYSIAGLTCKRDTYLVVDIGVDSVQVTPVSNNYLIKSANKYQQNYGLSVMDNYLLESIKNEISLYALVEICSNGVKLNPRLSVAVADIPSESTSYTTTLSGHPDYPIREVITNIRQNYCYVSKSLQEATELAVNHQSTEFNIGRHKFELQEELVLASESLFIETDEYLSLPQLIQSSIQSCAIDCRKDLLKNCILVGPGASLKGLQQRLCNEIPSLEIIKSEEFLCFNNLLQSTSQYYLNS
jgi:Actin